MFEDCGTDGGVNQMEKLVKVNIGARITGTPCASCGEVGNWKGELCESREAAPQCWRAYTWPNQANWRDLMTHEITWSAICPDCNNKRQPITANVQQMTLDL